MAALRNGGNRALAEELESDGIKSIYEPRPAPPAPDNTEQCHTCKHEGTRACMSHGYPEVPKSCQYKLGTHAEESMRNLNGTSIERWTKEHELASPSVSEARKREILQSLRGAQEEQG